ncbi:MAG: SDR family oxidoreductase [Rubricoccaceae bacterium]
MARILVTGPTGTVGFAVLRRLLDTGHAPVAALRGDAERALPEGAERVRMDFTDPGSFGPALRGIEGVFLMRPPQIANVKATLVPFMDAAEAAGVRRVAFLSVLGAEKNPLLPHRVVERRLERGALAWTHLRASYFMQNLAGMHAADIRAGHLSVPAGDGKTSFVDARDVGEAAAVVLTVPGHEHRAYDLTGPEALDYFEVARVLSEVLGRRVEYRRPGSLEFLRREQERGTPTSLALVMAGIYATARLGLADRVEQDLGRVLGRSPRTLAQFAADYRDAWA